MRRARNKGMRGACGEGVHQQSPVSAEAAARGAARCVSSAAGKWSWCSGFCPRRRWLSVACTWPWCPGHFPRRRDIVAAGEEQLGRCAAEQSKCYRLYLDNGKVTLAAMYLRRFRVVSRSFAAALSQVARCSFAAAQMRVITVVKPPAAPAQNLFSGD
jgi:hypothetical protein